MRSVKMNQNSNEYSLNEYTEVYNSMVESGIMS